MAHAQQVHPSWADIERLFCAALILAKVILFFGEFTNMFGYDVSAHLELVSSVSWLWPFPDVNYYATHPALGFLLAKFFAGFVHIPIVGVQAVGFVSSLAIFLLLRETLRALGLLVRPAGIAFLYLTAGLPLQAYLQVTVNLDVQIFAWAMLTLYLSVRLAITHTQRVMNPWVLGIAGSIIAACLTKENGILLVAIPPLVVVCLARRYLWLHAKRFAVMLAVAFVGVFPYYFIHHYLSNGEFFYNEAGHTLFVEEMKAGTKWRDERPLEFASSFIADYPGGEARIDRVWRGLWRLEDRPPTSARAHVFFTFYLWLAAPLTLLGFLLFVLCYSPHNRWHAFGLFVLSFSAVQVLFLIAFIYRYPINGYIAKTIYIAPIALMVGYLLAQFVELPELIAKRRPLTALRLQYALLALVAIFMIANHVMPVY